MSFSNKNKPTIDSSTPVEKTANSLSTEIQVSEKPPKLEIRKIGIVSRDYRKEFPTNGRRDFSHTCEDVLTKLDKKGCDAVLFSLFSIIPDADTKNDFSTVFSNLKNIKAIFIEEFQDGEPRTVIRNIVYYFNPDSSNWHGYEFHQKFGQGSQVKKVIDGFKNDEIPNRRVMGNCCVLLCGETNGATCGDDENRKRTVVDTYKLREAIFDKGVNVILNPIHDRMTRYEMKLKRAFLSENGKWVISVWNKGRKNIHGQTRDGKNPAWTVFYDRKELDIEPIDNEFGVEIGIVDTSRPSDYSNK